MSMSKYIEKKKQRIKSWADLKELEHFMGELRRISLWGT